MHHPWTLLATRIKEQGRTQKQFALLAWKKVSEVNELIKGKRNITIPWDYLFHTIFETPLKYWILLQIDYEYELFLAALPPSPEENDDLIRQEKEQIFRDF
jgi:plasmid maintenance system antidote protein VapI